jgi:hypothetical protein
MEIKIDFRKRIAPDFIKNVGLNEVFVFGSNYGGRHSKGAAKTAMGMGAVYGQADGLMGRTYGIPTKPNDVRITLPIDKIAVHVEEFIAFAKTRPDLIFLVTEIGCGLAGLKPKDVAPLFKDAITVDNIHLPARFWHKLGFYEE